MLIFLFTALVIGMTLLVVYKKDKNEFRRMLACGRCGLPGLPNLKYNSPWQDNSSGDKPPPSNSDPFDSQLETLSRVIVEKRKQIVDSKGRVITAEDKLKNLHITSLAIQRRYKSIMDELKDELESADQECKQLNKHIGKANTLKQKFFSEKDDECNKSALPEPPKRTSKRDWNQLPLCYNQSNQPNQNICHPPLQKPPDSPPLSCLCPHGSKNPLSTCIPPRPICPPPCPPPPPPCPAQSPPIPTTDKRSEPATECTCDSPQSSKKPDSFPCPPPLPTLLPNTTKSFYRNQLSQNTCNSPMNSSPNTSCSCTPKESGQMWAQNATPNSSCCCTPKQSEQVYTKQSEQVYTHNSTPNSSCCCTPKQSGQVFMQNSTSNTSCYFSPNQSESICTQKTTPNSSCSCSPEQSGSLFTQKSTPSTCSCTPKKSGSISKKKSFAICSDSSYESFSLPSSSPMNSSLCSCSTPGMSPAASTPQFIKKPPFSSFLGERMQPQPILRKSFKQTVVTECIEGEEDETGSWLEPTIVTEVTTSSITYPPNCCRSAYQEYVNAAAATPKLPSVKLPVIIDECDPCAEIPREISVWEDTENITHSCGTQTLDENDARLLSSSSPSPPLCKP